MKGKLFLVITLMIPLFLSCQRGQAPEKKKQVEIQKREVKQLQPIEEKSIDQPKQNMQQAVPEEQAKQEKEGPLALRPSSLTEEEQKEFEKFGGNWETPSVFKNEKEAIKYLKILLKGNEKNIRWYQKLQATEERKKWKYGDNIATALDAINTGTNKEGFELAVKVLETKRDYPEALARAALVVKSRRDPSVIPVLREIAKHPVPSVRLEVAGSLLSLGDSETALPILDELIEREGYVQALYYLFSAPGKIIDQKGFNILEKELTSPNAEMRISATKLLLESKKITRGKAEDIALRVLEDLKEKTIKDFGYQSIPEWPPNPNAQEAKRYYSNCRACDYTIALLSELQSSKSISVLKSIRDKNTEWWYVCKRGVKEAIEAIEK
jgi:hypothetical protein